MRTDIPSLHNFLEVLSGYGLEYDSDDTSYYSSPTSASSLVMGHH
jgi:hypothetical protein